MIAKFKMTKRKLGLATLIVLAMLIIGNFVYESFQRQLVLDPKIAAVDLLKSMETSSELLLRLQGRGAVFLSAEETRGYFAERIQEWEALKDGPTSLPPTDLTLYLNLAEDFKVLFYESNPEMAMVQHLNHYRFFKIPKGTYEKLTFDYSIRSYVVAEPIMNAIGDGQLSKRESVNDTPVNGNYKMAQVGNFTYYFYQQAGKYYVEAPYFFIKELKPKTYEEAVLAIPQ